MKVFIYQFQSDDPGISFDDRVGVVVALSKERAIEMLKEKIERHYHQFIEEKQIRELDINQEKLVCWAYSY